jgi:hypothetical protein
MAVAIEERVTNLEELMAQLIQTVGQTSHEMREFKDEMRDFKDEMLVFKNEMRDFKDEMLVFKDGVDEFKNGVNEFKDETRDFKNGVDEFKNGVDVFKEEMLNFKTESRKRWGELSNKMGTMVEDLVAPSIPRIVQAIVSCPLDTLESAIRVRRRNAAGQRKEFDAVATCGPYLFINETKSPLTPEHIQTFVQELLPTVREFFPEHAAKQVIGIIASLYVDSSLVQYAEKQGLVILGFGQDVMDVLNFPDFIPHSW